jgi:hypothetical protein
MTTPLALLETANKLLDGDATEADLRRAISTAYYAVFNLLCSKAADFLIGDKTSKRANEQAFRSMGHAQIKSRCEVVRNGRQGFPRSIENFADMFCSLQEAREMADYSRNTTFDRPNSVKVVAAVGRMIETFESADQRHQRNFVVFCLLDIRRGGYSFELKGRPNGDSRSFTWRSKRKRP